MKRYIKNRATINILLITLIFLKIFTFKNIDLIITIFLTYNLTCYLLDNFKLRTDK